MAGSLSPSAPAPASALRRLPVGYYLENFEFLIAATLRDYGDLIDDTERSFARRFSELPLDARRLYVRLLTRRGPWFRRDRLRYAEIDCVAGSAALEAAGFAGTAPSDATATRLSLLSSKELREWLDEPAARIDGVFRRVPWDADRTVLEQALLDAAGETELALRVPLLGLEGRSVVRTFELLFFGNLRQDLREFVLGDLGVLRFEQVALDGRTFSSRAAVEEHLLLHAALEALPAAVDEASLALAGAAALSARHRENARMRDAVLNETARRLERRGCFQEALALYAESRTPPARERRARILARHRRLAEAGELRAEMAASPRDESERLFAERGPRGRRPAPPSCRHIVLPPAAVSPAVLGAAPSSIEARCLEALVAEGYRGFFAENWLWRSLFGLAFWDIVFAPVRGAFVQPFQYGPRDLHDGFRAAREALVAARLEALRQDPSPGAALLERWDRKFGIANRLVAFAPELRPHLELALSVLDGARLAALCDRLSGDIKRYGCGFPDLFLIHPDGEILLAEVKGPGDVLRPEQESWLAALQEAGFRTIVLQAREQIPTA